MIRRLSAAGRLVLVLPFPKQDRLSTSRLAGGVRTDEPPLRTDHAALCRHALPALWRWDADTKGVRSDSASSSSMSRMHLRRTSESIGSYRRRSSTAHRRGPSETPRKNQDRKVHRTDPLSTLLSLVSGGRLALMNARTRTEPTDPSSAVTCRHTDPLLPRKRPYGRYAPLSAVFAASYRRLGCARRFDAAAVAPAMVAKSGGRSPSHAYAVTSGTRAGGNG